jgi:hypothetical protein
VNLEKLVDFPTREHLFQNAAMIDVGKSDQGARKPPVELRAAWPTTLQGPVDFGGNLVVFTAESTVSLHVALLEQHLQQDRFGVQRVDPLGVRGDETSTPGDKVRSDELQTIEK